MSHRNDKLKQMLRWYPLEWRERYGDEFIALLEDSLHDVSPSLRLRFSTAWAGLRERGHHSGLLGDHQTPTNRLRAASLLILCSWSAFVLAGASFSKLSEHFAAAMPLNSKASAQIFFNVVSALGIASAVVVLVGAGVAAPTFVKYLRRRGWSSLLRLITPAFSFTLFTVGAAVAVMDWAHHLSTLQRNGGNGLYAVTVVGLGVAVAVSVALWTYVAVHHASRIEFSHLVLRSEAVLACLLSGMMIAMTFATALWWLAVGSNAPWFLQGARFGVAGSPISINIVLTMLLMLVSGAASILGLGRIVHVWREA
jgi:MFS family permease